MMILLLFKLKTPEDISSGCNTLVPQKSEIYLKEIKNLNLNSLFLPTFSKMSLKIV